MISRIIPKCSWNQVLFVKLENKLNHHRVKSIFHQNVNILHRFYSNESEIESDNEFETDLTKLCDVRLTLYPTSTDPVIQKINEMETSDEFLTFFNNSFDSLEKEQFLQVS